MARTTEDQPFIPQQPPGTNGDGDRRPSNAVRRRAHPSQGARTVALAASLVATGGVAGALAFADRPTGAADVVATVRSTTSGAGASAAASSAAYADGSWTGTAQYTRWGDVQVRATVDGGTLVDVEVLQSPSDGKSAGINAASQPILEAEAIAEQGADLDIVSGATYTSRAYAASLQAALDAAAQADAGTA